LARTDGLTGIANRRHLFELGAQEMSRARRFGHPLCALMLDIDHFKQVNDIHGHVAGDRILKIVARCFLALVRDIDVVARYGGEEFVILLVETDLTGARILAERLREQVAKTVAVTDQGPLTVTISLGVACAQLERDDFAALLVRADSALYSAKQAGRNRVEAG
jgi:diguanylate cyclase (GGDEF)-like protein